MKQFLCAVLLISLAFTPFSSVRAEEPDIAQLQAKLAALSDHLARLTARTLIESALSHDRMREVIEEGVAWLLSAQENSGHFSYEYVPYEDRYRDDDNIVRQGGALFALGEVYRRQKEKDPRIEEGIIRAAEYFEGISITGKKESISFRCVANGERSSQCKLGATALVLAGLLGYVEGKEEVSPAYKTLIRDYTNYMLASQKKEGGFSNVYRTQGGFAEEESPFSNGEALLALVRAYQYQKDDEVKRSIDDAFVYLEPKEYDSALYLWIMAALKDMQKLWPHDAYVQYARDFTSWRIALAPRTPKDRNYCAYVEGVASAYSVLETQPQRGELAQLHTELDMWNAYHASLQLHSNDLYRVVTDAQGKLSLKTLAQPQLAEGGFLTAQSNPTQRIDFTQHCVSAYTQTLVEIDGQEL
jgi:hypothetical protein